jgi:Tfp pilus assembly major pilin PilA
MKILKTLLIVVAILIAIPLVAALFVKNSYAVEREITINKPESEVFNYIKLLKNQNNYSKWASMDPEMKQEYAGTDGKAGFVSSWESDKRNVGKGEQTILKIEEGERIDYELHFIEPFEGMANAYMTTDAVSDHQTIVKWGFASKMNYPMNAMLLFMDMEEMIGNDLSEGLENLKMILED